MTLEPQSRAWLHAHHPSVVLATDSEGQLCAFHCHNEAAAPLLRQHLLALVQAEGKEIKYSPSLLEQYLLDEVISVLKLAHATLEGHQFEDAEGVSWNNDDVISAHDTVGKFLKKLQGF